MYIPLVAQSLVIISLRRKKVIFFLQEQVTSIMILHLDTAEDTIDKS